MVMENRELFAKYVVEMICPVTGQGLRVADEAVVSRVNERLESGELKNRSGAVLDEVMDGGLVTDDGLLFYPIREGIPLLLGEEAVLLGEGS